MPYSGVSSPTVNEKIDRCVEAVMKTGKDKGAAVAICRAAIPGAMTRKAEADAPNYHDAGPANLNICETCKFSADKRRCTKYDFNYRNGWTCDAWRPDVEATRRRHQELSKMDKEAGYAYGPGGLLSPRGLKPDMPNSAITTEKREIPGAVRRNLSGSDFLFPKLRSFPIVKAADVKAAVNSWGRASNVRAAGFTFEDFKRRLTAMAKRKGEAFVKALPMDWTEGSDKERTPDSTFKVYKDKTGAYRWLSISSTAYRDRDGEIVSIKALSDDVARADTDGNYGPLRFWHVPGWDIGDCDFNMMVGKALVEGGTFRRKEYAEGLMKRPPAGVSIGFNHPATEPDAEKVFNQIRRFERSIIPQGATPSNRFTQFITVKEVNMSTKVTTTKLRGLIEQFDDPQEAIKILLEAGAIDAQAKEAGLQDAYKEAPEADEATGFEYRTAEELAELTAAEMKEYAEAMEAFEAGKQRQKTYREEFQEFIDFQVEKRLQEKARRQAPAQRPGARLSSASDYDELMQAMGELLTNKIKEHIEPLQAAIKEIQAQQLGRRKEVAEGNQALETIKLSLDHLAVNLGHVQDGLDLLTDTQPAGIRRGYRATEQNPVVKEHTPVDPQLPTQQVKQADPNDPMGVFVGMAETFQQKQAGQPIPDKGWGNGAIQTR